MLFTEVGSAQAVFLPENFAALGNPNPYQIGQAEADVKGPIRSFLSEMATRHGVWIFAGTVPLSRRPDGAATEGEKVRAASLVIDPSGNEVARYDKMHMFDVEVDDQHKTYRESDTFEAGTAQTVVNLPFARVGLSVCYDIRFSEFYLALLKSGAELITVPSAFTVPTGEAHFEVLMRARAIESFCFMVAACQGGSHDSGRQTYGHSMVVNPWGEVIAKAEVGESVVIADVDVSEVHTARSKMPILDQRVL